MSLFQNPLVERVYNQNDITVSVNGIKIEGFMEGSSVKVAPAGGEVEITQGLDGPGLNRASRQGGRISMTLREGSSGHAVLQALRILQDQAPVGAIVIVSTGVGAVATLLNALVSLPGELSTGDKKQGSHEYHLVGTTLIQTPPVVSSPIPSLSL
jgi:hypothetical protein